VPLRNLSSKVTAVEVMVAIDESGKVVKAEPQPQPGVNPVMMSAALQAARQWTFDPARRGDQPVASEMLLRFNFAPGP
jgi:TonB family protein